MFVFVFEVEVVTDAPIIASIEPVNRATGNNLHHIAIVKVLVVSIAAITSFSPLTLVALIAFVFHRSSTVRR